MLQYDITAQVRNGFGKGANRTLRRAGQAPAVIYGSGKEPMALVVDIKGFTKTLLDIQRRNAVINLTIEAEGKSETRQVMIKELQKNPIDDSLVHADFLEISLEAPMTLSVPVKYTGKAKGVDMGGDMEITVNELPLKGKVLDIPDLIEVDVTPLELGSRFTCKDLPLPANVTLMKNADKVCVSISGAAQQ